ncbi:fasciclin domain-containing protein [Hymenobacter sp. DH14]|uniref:Fasciclin domain-containing protein n=1 Tax=Hymenobacter cyanobacteriorum TaxID=2926463 RepID=A0A9X2AHR7_9BACT|nr:fasciclin domain-containing protein [Hymenobacter cyanobacteriorum]MCI1189188.1 fasciclin domain-containing protein [Hymenobacter cyanobacteriorum]
MKIITPLKTGVLLLGLALAGGGCAKNKDVDPSITNIAVTNPDFQLLEDAAIRGGVAITLGNKNPNDPQGNYTVFAPNNAAFNRLGVREAVDLTALQPDFLTKTLLYHVYSGSLAGSALAAGSTSASLLGPTRRIITRADGSKYVNGSKILGTDVKAANGLVHPIDKVMIATGGNVVESAVALQSAKVFTQPELTLLVAAVVKCNLAGLLSQPGPYTVFAPTDQAFRDAGYPTVDYINNLTPAQVTALTGVLANHVLAGNLGNKFSPELPDGTSVTTFGGGSLQLGTFSNGVLTIKSRGISTPANLAIPDVQCTNGVVHVIDRVLRP